MGDSALATLNLLSPLWAAGAQMMNAGPSADSCRTQAKAVAIEGDSPSKLAEIEEEEAAQEEEMAPAAAGGGEEKSETPAASPATTPSAQPKKAAPAAEEGATTSQSQASSQLGGMFGGGGRAPSGTPQSSKQRQLGGAWVQVCKGIEKHQVATYQHVEKEVSSVGKVLQSNILACQEVSTFCLGHDNHSCSHSLPRLPPARLCALREPLSHTLCCPPRRSAMFERPRTSWDKSRPAWRTWTHSWCR